MKSRQMKQPFPCVFNPGSAALIVLTVLFLLGATAVMPVVLHAQISQTNPQYPVGVNPEFVVLGDFDGNGISDAAVANTGTNTVSILLGKGSGKFQSAVNYFVGPNPISIAVGDFNKDGKADLVVATLGSASVAVLLGKGDGTFNAAVNYAVQSGPVSVGVGDFNGDGKLDIAVANEFSASVSILLGNGDGTFQTAVNYTVGTNPVNLLVTDLNKDGKLDLVVANLVSSNISVLVGKGDGTFATAVNYATATGPNAIAIGDLNNDGKLDLVATAGQLGVISVLLGNGDATFQTATNFTFVQSNPSSVAMTDVNTDGKLDLVVTNAASDTVSVLFGIGDGTFYGPVNFVVPGGPASAAIGDFNGDHVPDLAIACHDSSSLFILTGLAGGSFTTALNYNAGAGPSFTSNVVSADFNGDGKPDLAGFSRSSSTNNLSILLSNGDGTFQVAKTVNAGVAPNYVVAGDFNADGKADLAIANAASSNVSVLLGKGDGTFATAVTYGVGGVPLAIAMGDFNHDGMMDVLAVISSGVSFLAGKGDGTFQAFAFSPVPFGGSPTTSVTVADLNGDGILDLVIADPVTYSVTALLGNGDGTFHIAFRTSAGALPTSVAVGDLNGDGKPDIVAGIQSFSGVFAILWGNGDGTFQAPVYYQPVDFPGTISAVAVGDFTGDGIPDVAATNNLANRVYVIPGTGHGTFQPTISNASGASPAFLLATDLNGDGKLDLAVGMAGGISILLNSATFTTTSSVLSVPTGGVTSAMTADIGRTVQTGYARVTVNSGNAPYGTAVFSLDQDGTTVSETGVPASPPTTSARVFVEYHGTLSSKSNVNAAASLAVNTGIALVNEGTADAQVTCRLFDTSGNLLAIGHGTLLANTHYSGFISELSQWMPDFVVPATFSSAIQFGSLQIDSDQAFSVVALRLTTNQRGETLLSSTPLADLSRASTSDSLFLPRVVDGGGWRTSFYLMNTSSTAAETGTAQLLDPSGAPLAVRLTNGSSGTSFPYTIPANGVFVFQTDGSPSTTNAGWMRITPGSGTTAPTAIGLLGFTQGGNLVTESGIPSVLPTTHARIYIDKSHGHNTGLAIANPGGGHLSVALSAFQTNGVTPAGSGAASLALNGNAGTAVFVDQLISGLPDGFTGVLDISSSSPFAPLTLRTLTNSRNEFLITTFPVADFNQPAPSPIVFPQIADGAGYQTQFIFLSTRGSADTTIHYFNNVGAPVAIGKTNH